MAKEHLFKTEFWLLRLTKIIFTGVPCEKFLIGANVTQDKNFQVLEPWAWIVSPYFKGIPVGALNAHVANRKGLEVKVSH